MSLHTLTIARDELKQFQPGTTLGLESRDALNHMAVGFTTFINELTVTFNPQNLIASLTRGNSVSEAMKKLQKQPYASLDKFLIRTPEGVVGPMYPYVVALDAAIDETMDVKERILEPLKQWLQKAIANPGHIEKVWLEKIQFVDVDNHLSVLAKHYNDKVGDDLSFTSITQAYPSLNDFDKTGEMMRDIVTESTNVMGKDIPKICSDISSLVTKLVDANDRADFMEKAPKASMAKLSDVLYHAARDVELLSILVFQIRIASKAYDESVEKINASKL
jgi:hypothetical protein